MSFRLRTTSYNSADFPLINPFDATLGQGEAFVAKFNIAGDAFVYSTFLGGNSDFNGGSPENDGAFSIAITTTPVAANKTVTVSAKNVTIMKSARLTVKTAAASALALDPASVQGGVTSPGTMTRLPVSEHVLANDKAKAHGYAH